MKAFLSETAQKLMLLLKEASVREYLASLFFILKGPQANIFENNYLPVLGSNRVLPLVSVDPEPCPEFTEASYMSLKKQFLSTSRDLLYLLFFKLFSEVL